MGHDLHAIDLKGVAWRRSSFSTGGENCVEIADLPGGGVAIRDSKSPRREALRCTAQEWTAFTQGLIHGAV